MTHCRNHVIRYERERVYEDPSAVKPTAFSAHHNIQSLPSDNKSSQISQVEDPNDAEIRYAQ